MMLSKILGCCVGFCLMMSGLSAYNIPQSAVVATDSAGNSVAVWELVQDAATIVQGAYCPISSGTWSTPATLSLPNTDSSMLTDHGPVLAMNDNGHVAVIWAAFDSVLGINRIFCSTISSPGTASWSASTALSSTSEDVLNSYSIVINQNQAFASYQSFSTSFAGLNRVQVAIQNF